VAQSSAGAIDSGDRRHLLRFDDRIPRELVPAALAGGGLILWAALRAGDRAKALGWSLALCVALLVGGQAPAVVSGPASGAIPGEGWPYWLVRAMLAGRELALARIGPGESCCWATCSGRPRGPDGLGAVFPPGRETRTGPVDSPAPWLYNAQRCVGTGNTRTSEP